MRSPLPSLRRAFASACLAALCSSAWAAEPAKPAAATAAPDAQLSIAPAQAPSAAQPKLQPATSENFIVYREAGRYGGWPANHGLWQWGDELVVGFDAAWHQATTTDHRIDRTQPILAYQARSLDGGRTWSTERDLPFTDPRREPPKQPLTQPLDFTAANFALMFRFGGLHAGPSWFYTTADRCKTWAGPYSFTVEGVENICTRTDFVVLGPRDCLMFGSCAKQNDGKEGRVFCARTEDGGLTWKLVSFIGPEPQPGGYAIMPSSLRLQDGSLLTLIRRSEPKVSGFIEAWRSTDLGATWTLTGKAVSGIGGNPPALVQLPDGRVAFSYGFRHKPSGMRACISADGGKTWGAEIVLREDGYDGDLGYPRSVARPDGKVLTVYYYNGPQEADRSIEATLWTPPAASTAAASAAAAEVWGAYAIHSASAPNLLLEVAGGEAKAGTAISINRSGAGAQQQWAIVPHAEGWVALRPASVPTLALTASQAGTKNGTPLTLAPDTGAPEQLWRLEKHANGNYSLLPKHAAGVGLDHFGGRQEPGAKIDLWSYRADDQHLQWIIKPLAGSALASTSASAASPSGYTPVPPKPGALQPGTTREFVYTESQIFPGTTRKVTVFIPAQYDGRQPACVYVKTDGYNAKEKELLETMIATGEMPVTVGVFVQPGTLPAPMPGTLGRRNRCFEYDAVNDNHVRFLHEELLPYVAREFQLNLSQDGNDRCISGGSSGGITAFTAAWLKPQWFSRVYCASGSFVAFRGGHEYPTMVRKFEAKPLRAFLTTGTRDMENAAGDWYLVDQEMEKALKFSGYEYQFRTIEGGHVAGYMENWREAMAYLWQGWPKRVPAGPSAPRARDFLIAGETWQPVAEGYQRITAAALRPSGEVFFSDAEANTIFNLTTTREVSPFAREAGYPSSLTVGPDGTLYTASLQQPEVAAFNSAGQRTVLLRATPGDAIMALPKGGLYLSVPMLSVGSQSGSIWHVQEGQKRQVAGELSALGGLALRPDQWLLAATARTSKWAYSWQVNPDGSLSHGERFFHLHVADWDDDAQPTGAAYAREGQLFIATRAGIQVCADDGPTQVILPLPDGAPAVAVCLGGKDFDTLYAFSAHRVWARKVQVHGIGAFSPWAKVSGTKL